MSTAISEQSYYTGKGPLDEKIKPVATIEDLNKTIPRTRRFIGLTVTVLDDGLGQGPHDYWLKEKDNVWVLKEAEVGVIDCGEY